MNLVCDIETNSLFNSCLSGAESKLIERLGETEDLRSFVVKLDDNFVDPRFLYDYIMDGKLSFYNDFVEHLTSVRKHYVAEIESGIEKINKIFDNCILQSRNDDEKRFLINIQGVVGVKRIFEEQYEQFNIIFDCNTSISDFRKIIALNDYIITLIDIEESEYSVKKSGFNLDINIYNFEMGKVSLLDSIVESISKSVFPSFKANYSVRSYSDEGEVNIFISLMLLKEKDNKGCFNTGFVSDLFALGVFDNGVSLDSAIKMYVQNPEYVFKSYEFEIQKLISKKIDDSKDK